MARQILIRLRQPIPPNESLKDAFEHAPVPVADALSFIRPADADYTIGMGTITSAGPGARSGASQSAIIASSRAYKARREFGLDLPRARPGRMAGLRVSGIIRES